MIKTIDWETIQGLIEELIYIRDNCIHSSEDSRDILIIETTTGEFIIAFGNVDGEISETVFILNKVSRYTGRLFRNIVNYVSRK